MEKPIVAVMGGGHGGFGLTGHLSLKGFQVRLFEFSEFKESLEPLDTSQGIYIHGILGEGTGKPSIVTTDAEEAIGGADVVFVVIPAWGHKRAAMECASAGVTPEQLIVLLPGNAGGALEFRQTFLENGGSPEVVIAETPSFIFACKKDSVAGGRSDAVWVRGIKKGLQVGVIPVAKTRETVKFLKLLYDEFAPAEDVLETSLTNVNHWMHPPITFMNIARVESMGGGFPYVGKGWGAGATQSVCRLIEAVDADRLTVVKELGYEPITALEHWKNMYGHLGGMEGDTVYDAITNTPVYSGARIASSIEDRHFTEPVSYGLVPIASIGRELGLELPTITGLANVFCAAYGRDFWAEGRTVETMGLKGLSKEEIIHYAQNGSL